MDELILRLGLALAIGLLVGLERGWRERDEPEGSRTAGIRSYGIAGLLGGACAALAEPLGGVVLAVGLLAFAGAFGWFEARKAQAEGAFSVTATLAGLAVFALGALAVAGDHRAAAAGGAALAAVLASREALHALLKRLTWPEVRSALVLAAMTMIVLPILPDRPLDPWGGFNPRQVWFFTVLVAGISYLGYVAVRALGPGRGHLVGGLAGALVSSTAATVAFARAARAGGETASLAGAACFAAMVSVLRVCTIVLVIRPEVLLAMGAPALAAAVAFGASGAFLLRRRPQAADAAANPGNPFELIPLLVFAAAFAVVSTVNAALVGRFGDASLLASAAVSGAFDVDVTVLSALRLVAQGVATGIVGDAALVALLVNGLMRLALAAVAGPVAFSAPLLGATAFAALAGLGVRFLAPPFV